jgi:cytochrome c
VGWLHAEQKEFFKAKIVQETKAGEMPLPQYRMIHWNARISDRDMQNLTRWARGKPGDDASAQSVHEGDPVRGRETFEKRCTGCHAMNSDREGPRLQGVFGRTSGTVEGFTYSAALKNAHMDTSSRIPALVAFFRSGCVVLTEFVLVVSHDVSAGL